MNHHFNPPEIPHPTLDNPNDRHRLFLLQHIANPNRSQREELERLSAIYPNNHLFEEKIITELKLSGFIKPIDLQPDLPRKTETGQRIKHDKTWLTTPAGVTALLYTRFPSESKQLSQKTLSRHLSIITTIASILTAIATMLTAILTLL